MKAEALGIIKDVAANTGFSVEELTGKRRFTGLVEARHRAMAQIRERTALSYPEIGNLFNRDHSSVIHAVQKQRGSGNDQTPR